MHSCDKAQPSTYSKCFNVINVKACGYIFSNITYVLYYYIELSMTITMIVCRLQH